MARTYTTQTLEILNVLAKKPRMYTGDILKSLGMEKPSKDFYNTLYRLNQQELVDKLKDEGKFLFSLNDDGKKLLARLRPTRDGIWKLVIFDIPEKQKYVRVVLRAKLKSLHFKKWQNSIWISPYALDEEIEQELKSLSKKFFVRLIKTTDINETEDLEKLFKE